MAVRRDGRLVEVLSTRTPNTGQLSWIVPEVPPGDSYSVVVAAVDSVLSLGAAARESPPFRISQPPSGPCPAGHFSAGEEREWPDCTPCPKSTFVVRWLDESPRMRSGLSGRPLSPGQSHCCPFLTAPLCAPHRAGGGWPGVHHLPARFHNCGRAFGRRGSLLADTIRHVGWL